MSPTTRFLLSLLLLLLAAYTTSCSSELDDAEAPTPVLSTPLPLPPVLPNLLLQVTGQIEVRRIGSTLFVPVGMGAAVQPGDTLRLVDGNASIFCGNEALWDASPQSLSLDEEKGVPCQKGRAPRPAPDISGLRGEKDSVSGEIPYLLSPRSGFVLNERPTLRWQLLPGVETYTVTLSSDDGQERPPMTVSGDSLSYPAEWPPLEAGGASYVVQIEGGRLLSDQEGGFSFLAPQKAQQVNAKAERLRQRLSEDELSLTLVLAELYLNNKLRSEAVEQLLALPDGAQVGAIQHLLGQTYLEMGLLDEATAAYSQALTLAQEASLPEEQATAHLALGLAACAQTDHENARAHWEETLKLYEQMERAKDEVEALLAEVESKCDN